MSALKASAATILAQSVRMLSGLVVIKFIALTLGADGFGRLGHFMSLISILSVMAGGGVLNGIIKYVAEYKNSSDKLHAFLSGAAWFSFLFSLLLCVVLIFFAGPISHRLFDSNQFAWLIIFLAFIQFGYALANFCNGILNGLTLTVIFARVNVIGMLIALPVSSWLIAHYDFAGAVLGIALLNLGLLPPALYEIKKLGLFSKIKLSIREFYVEHARNIARFSAMQIVSLVTLPIAEIVIRSQIAQHFGWQETGFWQSLMRLSSVYLGFFTMFLAAYYMPVLSGMTEKKDSVRYVLRHLFAIGGVFFLIACAIYFLRHWVFLILFSSEFQFPAAYVRYQLVGDFFKILSYVIGFFIVARAKPIFYILLELIQAALYLKISFMFIESQNMDNVFLAYAISNLIYFSVCAAGLFIYARVIKDAS